MKPFLQRPIKTIFILMLTLIPLCCGDNGKETVDELTGNRAVKQFHKSKEDIENISKKQSEKYDSVLKDDEENKE